MYLSNRDIKWAIECGLLRVEPRPETFNCGYDETSIDLHLAAVEEAKVWDIARYAADRGTAGGQPDLDLGSFNYGDFSARWLIPPPEERTADDARVFRRGHFVVVKPGGFLLWQTREWIETPTVNPTLISFVNAKSTRARVGLVVHLTAPTIHAGWGGNITLEIANLGPFNFVLAQDYAIAQLTVAKITSSTDLSLKARTSQTQGQTTVAGAAPTPRRRPRR